MSFAYIAIYTSMIIWLFPAVRQYGSNLFYYFLILALADPIAYGLLKIFNIPALDTHTIGGILLYYSIDIRWENIKKYWVLNLIIIIGFFIAFFTLSNLLFLLIACHLLIFSKFIKYIIIRLHSFSEIDCFYLVLTFYELTFLVSFIVILSHTTIGYIEHYITLVFQLLIGIFFIIFRYNSRFLQLHLKK